MVGPSLDYVGGISAVVHSLMSAPAIEALDFRYYPSVGVGDRRQKIVGSLANQARFVASLGRRRLAGSAPDVVHVHAGGWVSLIRKALYLKEARLAGRVVLHAHGSNDLEQFHDRDRLRAAWLERVFRGADAVVVVSRHMQARMREWLGAEFPVHLVYNPVNVRDFDACLSRAPSPRRGRRRPTLLFMGWMLEFKGIFDLLDVLPRVLQSVPDALFRFGGDGADMDRMRAEVARRGLEESVELLGWITGQQKMHAFTAADVFCLPSHSEGLPITIIEAMSAGLPVVATRISGIPEEVIEGETGLLYALGDLDGLADAISRLLSDAALRAEMGGAGRRRVEAVFDRDVVAGQLVGLWRSL